MYNQFQLSKDWVIVKLGDKNFFKKIEGGGTPKRSISEYFGGKIPWVRLNDIKSKYIEKTEETLTETGLQRSGAKLVPQHTVILSTRATIGKVALSSVPLCTNQGFKSIICNQEKILPEYLFYYLKSIKSILLSRSGKTTFKEINKSTLEKIDVLIPPLKFQKEIVSNLDKVVDLQKKRQKVIELSNLLFQAKFTTMFKESTNLSDTQIKDVSILITKGDSPLWKGHRYQKQGIPIIRIKNMKNFRIDLSDADYISAQVHNNMKRSQLKPDDVLISIAGTLGRLAIVTSEVCPANMNQDQAVIRFERKKIIPLYGLYALSIDSVQNQISNIKRGATRMHLNLKQVGELKISLPSLERQLEFVTFVESLNQSLSKSYRSKKELFTLYKSLEKMYFDKNFLEMRMDKNHD